MDIEKLKKEAQKELQAERERQWKEKYKEKLKTKKSIMGRLFPWKIIIIRRK